MLKKMMVMLALLLCAMMIPLAASAAGSAITTTLGEQPFMVGEWQEFTVTTSAGDDAGTMVKGYYEFTDSAVIEDLEYLESQDGLWYDLPGNEFGPPSGFPLIDGTSKFRVKINQPGNYTFSVSIVNADGTVLCSKEASFMVQTGSQLATDIANKTFVVGVPTEFTFSTVANGHRGTMVKGIYTFSDPDAVEKLEYYEQQNGQWYVLNGPFGPDDGFPMSDATSRFRVTFKKAGTYSFEVNMVTLQNEVLCSTKASFPVVTETIAAAGGSSHPKTGDEANLILWFALASMSAAAMVVLARKRKEA